MWERSQCRHSEEQPSIPAPYIPYGQRTCQVHPHTKIGGQWLASDFHPYRTPTSTLRPEARIPSQLYLTSNHQQSAQHNITILDLQQSGLPAVLGIDMFTRPSASRTTFQQNLHGWCLWLVSANVSSTANIQVIDSLMLNHKIPSLTPLRMITPEIMWSWSRARTYCVRIEPLCIPDEREQSPAVHHSSKQNADLSTALHGTLADQHYNVQWQRL